MLHATWLTAGVCMCVGDTQVGAADPQRALPAVCAVQCASAGSGCVGAAEHHILQCSPVHLPTADYPVVCSVYSSHLVQTGSGAEWVAFWIAIPGDV